jgi:RHS repeat-associated protein
MGGGVGGMVYSIKDGGTTNENIICSHANHRGDVIARSDEDGSLTSFALYEAYGTRPSEYEWGTDPDRQKANTKEEETDLGLLNEGMRYRDLETGTFTTRDPIGYADGPNAYCYVHCNPITQFDAFGLSGQDSNETADDVMEQVYDDARLAEDSYNDPIVRPDGSQTRPCTQEGYEWVKDYKDNSIGFSASLYRKQNSEELYLVFRGTDPDKGLVEFTKDMDQNFKNGIGNPDSEQYQMAIKTTGDVISDFAGGDKTKLTLVGHSLGGGMASTAAVQYGVDAVTFNAAGMNPDYAKNSNYNANDYVNAYYIKGEILSHAQDRIPGVFNAAGNRHQLKTAPGYGIFPGGGLFTAQTRFNAHGMSSVLRSLETAGYNERQKERAYNEYMSRW